MSKIFLLLILAYLVNKVIIIPLKKEFSEFFKAGTGSGPEVKTQKTAPRPLVREEDIEDAEFKDLDE